MPSTMTVASRMQDRILYHIGVAAAHLSRDPQYGTRCHLRFRVSSLRAGRQATEGQTIEFNLGREDALALRDKLNAFLAIKEPAPLLALTCAHTDVSRPTSADPVYRCNQCGEAL